jgi:hypothetical protein
LHIALEPARTLLEPGLEPRRGFLERRRIEHRDAGAATRQANPKIGVLRDVEGRLASLAPNPGRPPVSPRGRTAEAARGAARA